MIDRPDWNLPVAAPSFDETHAAMARGDTPTPEQSAAILGSEPEAVPVPVPMRDANGRIIRPNWNQASATVHAQHDVPAKSRTDWGKPRDDSGRYVTKSEGEYRAHWEKEGGVAQVIQTVSRKEAAMLSVAPSIEAKIATLDKGFLTKAVDHLRLSPSYGPDGFWRSVKQFEDSLSASERETWAKFCRSLDADEQAALIWAISK